MKSSHCSGRISLAIAFIFTDKSLECGVGTDDSPDNGLFETPDLHDTDCLGSYTIWQVARATSAANAILKPRQLLILNECAARRKWSMLTLPVKPAEWCMNQGQL